MVLLQWIMKAFGNKNSNSASVIVDEILTLSEAKRVLEIRWNEYPYMGYEICQVDLPSKENTAKCCQKFMKTFVMISTMHGKPDGRRKTVFVCLQCGSCQYEGQPRNPAGYLVNLQEEQQLQTDFPERYMEYKDYLNNFAADGIYTISPLTFKEFFFRENHKLKLRPEIASLLESANS